MEAWTETEEPVAYVNGKRYVLPKGRAEITLLQYLRELGLTGTKVGCGEGGCGACTVMVSTVAEEGGLLHRSVNACLCPLYAVEGAHVVTVEGIGNKREGMHPVQERLSRAHGSQCGFCTPGFVMSMYALLRSKTEPPSEEEIEENLAGNLCRCTGYRPIIDAFKAFSKVEAGAYTEEAIQARQAAGSPPAVPQEGLHAGPPPKSVLHKGQICPSTGRPCDCGPRDVVLATRTADKDEEVCGPILARGPSCEPIFPPELRRREPPELYLPGPFAAWYRPKSKERLLELKKKFPHAKLVVGNSEVGIEMKFKHAQYPVLIGVTHVPDLNRIEVGDEGLRIGASVTLSCLMERGKEVVAARPAHQTSAVAAIREQLRWFAGNQIRNTASVGGNIATGSPISDLNPLWMAAGAVFTVEGSGTAPRQIPADQFFLGYRKTAMEEAEVLTEVFLPWTRPLEVVREFKQAHRRDDDIAIVNAGMRALLAESPSGGWEIADAHIAYGGVAPLTVMARKTEKALRGRPLDQETLSTALAALREDVFVNPGAPGGWRSTQLSGGILPLPLSSWSWYRLYSSRYGVQIPSAAGV
eukprot:jgi/Botrbrau1/672/Bobra.0161s0055.1